MKQYTYNGPVMEFDRCIMNNFKASTFAFSKQKALSNLAYQFKRQHNKAPGTRISLPGKLVQVV